MKKFVMFAAAILFATAPALVAADKTWNGVLSDSQVQRQALEGRARVADRQRSRLRRPSASRAARSTCSCPAARPTRSRTRTMRV